MMGLAGKQFTAILISLVLTNVNFYASIKVLEKNDGYQDHRLEILESKVSINRKEKNVTLASSL